MDKKVGSRLRDLRGIRNPGVRQFLGFCLANEDQKSAAQKTKHCLTPGSENNTFQVTHLTNHKDTVKIGKCDNLQ